MLDIINFSGATIPMDSGCNCHCPCHCDDRCTCSCICTGQTQNATIYGTDGNKCVGTKEQVSKTLEASWANSDEHLLNSVQ